MKKIDRPKDPERQKFPDYDAIAAEGDDEGTEIQLDDKSFRRALRQENLKGGRMTKGNSIRVTEEILQAGAPFAARYLRMVIEGIVKGDRWRIRACEIVIYHTCGRPAQRIDLSAVEGGHMKISTVEVRLNPGTLPGTLQSIHEGTYSSVAAPDEGMMTYMGVKPEMQPVMMGTEGVSDA